MRQRPPQTFWPSATRTVLVISVVACASLLLPHPVDYPRVFDPDDATQGIFVNDLSFRDHFAASFLDSAEYQDRYRADWAAHRLPFSLLASALQRGFAIPPHAVGDLLLALGACFALLGSWLASVCLTRGTSATTTTRLAIVGISLAHPSLALLARTGASFYLFAYALFWGSLCFAIRYAETHRTRDLVGAAGCVAVFIANPYPPILALVPCLVILYATLGQLRETLRTPRIYAAVGLATFSAASGMAVLGMVFETSLATYVARLWRFQQARGAAVSWAQLFETSLIDKLHKWVDQHFLFLVDGLGDPTRSDILWTLGSYHAGFLGFLPLIAYGAWLGLRRHESSARIALAVLAGFGLVFLTVSFPEGRYTVALVPCYAALALTALRQIVPNPEPRRLILAAVLGLLALETQHAIAHAYGPSRQRIWAPPQGMLEAVPALNDFSGQPLGIRWPEPVDYAGGLYFRMVMDPAWGSIDDSNFEALLDRQDTVRLASVEPPHSRRSAHLEAAGFRPFTRIQTEGPNGTSPLTIWVRPPLRPARSQDPGPSR
ncbi:hypothetical protein MK489_20250 [Myxococcota bacterium]|nr:hypothetical protein [Myxococcota bacterium]